MSYEQKDNSGSLFKNDDQREGKQDPTHKGSARLAGVDYWISAWVNESKKDGRRYFGLKFKPKERQPEAATEAKAPAADDFNDEIPFAWAFAVPFAGLLAAAAQFPAF